MEEIPTLELVSSLALERERDEKGVKATFQ
jgi:hypothetical protein